MRRLRRHFLREGEDCGREGLQLLRARIKFVHHRNLASTGGASEAPLIIF